MDYLTVEEAARESGTRLVLSAHVPGPWGEAAKAILTHHRVDFVAVAQEAMGPNTALQQWTGFRNAPILVTDSERPIASWLDILNYAEIHGQGPSLLPAQSDERATAIGLSAEICAPFGLGWSRRVLMFEKIYGPGDLAPDASTDAIEICRQYGYSGDAVQVATDRICDIVGCFVRRLQRQRETGSPYLVGNRLSVADIYAASFSLMLDPPTSDRCPMPDQVRAMWSDYPDAVRDAIDPVLIEHRDFIWAEHIGTPSDF